jgi:hypothetical protein
METISIDRKELRKIIRETFEDVLNDGKDLIGDAVVEAIEDIGPAKAMEEGKTGKFVNTGEFKKKLDIRVKGAK